MYDRIRTTSAGLKLVAGYHQASPWGSRTTRRSANRAEWASPHIEHAKLRASDHSCPPTLSRATSDNGARGFLITIRSIRRMPCSSICFFRAGGVEVELGMIAFPGVGDSHGRSPAHISLRPNASIQCACFSSRDVFPLHRWWSFCPQHYFLRVREMGGAGLWLGCFGWWLEGGGCKGRTY